MRRVIQTAGILIAAALIAGGCWVHWLMIEGALDYPTRLAGVAPGYPAAGTPAYYWGCTVALYDHWLSVIFPIGVGMLASAYTWLEIMGVRVTSYSIRPWFGLVIILLCLLPLLRLVSDPSFDFMRFATQAPWPAVALLVWPPSWRYALIVLASWSGCVLCGMGVSVPVFLVSGLALTTLNVYPIYLHGRTTPQPIEG